MIKFYRVNAEHGEFSNFAKYPITLTGKTWPTSEHYFQAMKFESLSDQEDIHSAPSAFEAAHMGNDRKRKLREDWESVKEGIMLEALMAKFTQHKDPRALLKSTGNAELVEHTSNNSYWADGGDGTGKNRLGYLLMQVRDEVCNRRDQHGGEYERGSSIPVQEPMAEAELYPHWMSERLKSGGFPEYKQKQIHHDQVL